jgi:hypothetical protein
MSTPYISLYLDYKVADEASTYKNVLFYGPIIPADYDYKTFIEEDYDYLYDIYPSERYFDEGEYKQSLEDFNKENGTTFKKYNLEVTKKLLENLLEDDKIITNKFHPLISSCNENEQILELLEDNDFQNLDYRLFISPKGCIENNTDCVTKDDISLDYLKKVIKEKSLDKEKVIEISNKIHSINCPITWYKNGDLKLSC